MERKSYEPADVELKSTGKGVVAAFSIFNEVDSDLDVVLPEAIPHGVEVPMSAFNHKSWEDQLPVGKGVVSVDGRRATFTATFFDTTGGKDTYETLKQLGPLARWSWGFDVVDSERGAFNGQRVRFIKKVRLYEVSPVLRGANDNTRTLAIKSTDATRAELRRIRDDLYRDILMESKARLDDECRREALRCEVERLYANYVKAVGVGYSYDRESIVPQTVRDAARAAVGVYAPELGLDRDRIRLNWFSAEDDTGASVKDEFVDFWSERPLLGRCRPKMASDVIELNSSLTEDDCWNVVPHELRHISHPEESEEDVRLYESWVRLRRMGY
ncbi:HK97 family phage prohead protease [Streptomyces cupreus]|uniref:HK97 family phage prohead protease n=1 Tax=Streptomyces cupreus TaxID=2759956 RepID=A0A7X1MDP0_9ACTN|nr:HK97 family phage prohead protease [Streptomyces cupreus]MBC2904930.1 HK97 family phage prohead protease [Streptomyces cupreus]